MPWWKFWEKSRIKEELAAIEDLYARAMQLVAAAPSSTPASTAASATRTPAAPSSRKVAGEGPVDAAPVYTSTVEALKSGAADAARSQVERLRDVQDRRRVLRGAEPRGER